MVTGLWDPILSLSALVRIAVPPSRGDYKLLTLAAPLFILMVVSDMDDSVVLRFIDAAQWRCRFHTPADCRDL